LSVVPNNILKSADSLELQTFGVNLTIDSALQRLDIYTRYLAYWKSCVIRNLHLTDNIQFRTFPNQPLQTVKPNSELPVKGWGSYMEITSASATPVGVVDFECVNIREAARANA